MSSDYDNLQMYAAVWLCNEIYLIWYIDYMNFALHLAWCNVWVVLLANVIFIIKHVQYFYWFNQFQILVDNKPNAILFNKYFHTSWEGSMLAHVLFNKRDFFKIKTYKGLILEETVSRTIVTSDMSVLEGNSCSLVWQQLPTAACCVFLINIHGHFIYFISDEWLN